MVEEKVKFQSSFSSGESALDLFLDSSNPYNKTAHPALPNVIQEQLEINKKGGENVLYSLGSTLIKLYSITFESSCALEE